VGQLAHVAAFVRLWLKINGADVKDAQALMRHSRASTTLDVYQQFIPESQQRVVDG
jgi:site-specific recombinase XerD